MCNSGSGRRFPQLCPRRNRNCSSLSEWTGRTRGKWQIEGHSGYLDHGPVRDMQLAEIRTKGFKRAHTGWFGTKWWTLWLLFHHPMDNPQQKSAIKIPMRVSATKLWVIAMCPASCAVNMIWCQNAPRNTAEVMYHSYFNAVMQSARSAR